MVKFYKSAYSQHAGTLQIALFCPFCISPAYVLVSQIGLFLERFHVNTSCCIQLLLPFISSKLTWERKKLYLYFITRKLVWNNDLVFPSALSILLRDNGFKEKDKYATEELFKFFRGETAMAWQLGPANMPAESFTLLHFVLLWLCFHDVVFVSNILQEPSDWLQLIANWLEPPNEVA